ncbi:MAG: thermonuclease family protein [Planctomyces sp.]|nr:thermonuclease family protein [Planctomyces sp.]
MWLVDFRKARRRLGRRQPRIVILCAVIAALAGLGQSIDLNVFPAPMRQGEGSKPPAEGGVISCFRPRVTDGDSFTCGGTRIRLANIDAPELPGHCRPGRRCVEGDAFAARDHLRSLAGGYVTCRAAELDHYGRTVAFCEAEGRDLSCAMVKSGHAARRYGGLVCPE